MGMQVDESHTEIVTLLKYGGKASSYLKIPEYII